MSPAPLERLGPAPTPQGEAPTELGDAESLSAFLFEEGAITDLALRVAASDVAALEADGDAEVPATLEHDGRSWSAGLRIKGNITRRGFGGKPSLKLDLGALAPEQRFFGLRRLTLNSMLQDASMLREHVSYALFRGLGVPAPRHGYARVTVNDAAYGLYGLVESMDQGFIDAWWPDDDEGNLYEGGYGGDVVPGREDDFTLQEEGTPAAPADLVALIESLEDATSETALATLERHFALDEVLDALAVDLLAGNWDGYARAANNYLLYRAPIADRWHLVPWGQDQAFDDRYVPIHAGWEGRILLVCGRSTACVARLYDRLPAVLASWDTLPAYAQRVATAISDDCEGDPRAELGCRPESVLEFLAERPGIVAEELDRR